MPEYNANLCSATNWPTYNRSSQYKKSHSYGLPPSTISTCAHRYLCGIQMRNICPCIKSSRHTHTIWLSISLSPLLVCSAKCAHAHPSFPFHLLFMPICTWANLSSTLRGWNLLSFIYAPCLSTFATSLQILCALRFFALFIVEYFTRLNWAGVVVLGWLCERIDRTRATLNKWN